MTKKAESRLQLRIRHALEGQFPGSYWWKVHGGPFTPAGVPDLAGVVLGRAVFVEVKLPGGRVSRIQTITQRRLASAGAIVAVATSVDEAVTQVRAGLANRPQSGHA